MYIVCRWDNPYIYIYIYKLYIHAVFPNSHHGSTHINTQFEKDYESIDDHEMQVKDGEGGWGRY